jgi:hypothetical protein
MPLSFPVCLVQCNPELRHRFQNTSLPANVLGQMNLVYTLTHCLPIAHFNIVLSPTFRSFEWSLFSGVLAKILDISNFPMRAAKSAYLILFDMIILPVFGEE